MWRMCYPVVPCETREETVHVTQGAANRPGKTYDNRERSPYVGLQAARSRDLGVMVALLCFVSGLVTTTTPRSANRCRRRVSPPRRRELSGATMGFTAGKSFPVDGEIMAT